MKKIVKSGTIKFVSLMLACLVALFSCASSDTPAEPAAEEPAASVAEEPAEEVAETKQAPVNVELKSITIKGTVADSEGKGIQGMAVSLSDADTGFVFAEGQVTDKYGQYAYVLCSNANLYNRKINVKIYDIDGDVNGSNGEKTSVVDVNDKNGEFVTDFAF